MAKPITKEAELYGDLFIELMSIGLRPFPVEESPYEGHYALETVEGYLLFKIVPEFPETPYQIVSPSEPLVSITPVSLEGFLAVIDHIYKQD